MVWLGSLATRAARRPTPRPTVVWNRDGPVLGWTLLHLHRSWSSLDCAAPRRTGVRESRPQRTAARAVSRPIWRCLPAAGYRGWKVLQRRFVSGVCRDVRRSAGGCARGFGSRAHAGHRGRVSLPVLGRPRPPRDSSGRQIEGGCSLRVQGTVRLSRLLAGLCRARSAGAGRGARGVPRPASPSQTGSIR